jgi:probable rRNA maturation factor
MQKYKIAISVKKGLTCPFTRDWVRKVIRTALEAEGVDYRLELGIMFTDNRNIQRLNKRYRFIDSPTDVLSFSFIDSSHTALDIPHPAGEENRIQIGEIIISLPMALEQASNQKIYIEQELALLLVHGALHLLGYDHLKPAGTRRMEEREKAIIKLTDGGK